VNELTLAERAAVLRCVRLCRERITHEMNTLEQHALKGDIAARAEFIGVQAELQTLNEAIRKLWLEAMK
jgi:hypothetical protein